MGVVISCCSPVFVDACLQQYFLCQSLWHHVVAPTTVVIDKVGPRVISVLVIAIKEVDSIGMNLSSIFFFGILIFELPCDASKFKLLLCAETSEHLELLTII